MKTEQFSLVLAIAREGSISKAAESLFISQPTASNMLKALESELGYPLFSRTRAGMIPTAEGAEFIDYAGAIERSLAAISHISQSTKRVDFAVLSGLSCYFTDLAFERLCEKHIGDGLTNTLSYLIEPKKQALMKAVENGNADIAVVVHKSDFREAAIHDAEKRGLDIIPIGELSLELTCNKDHPIIRGGKISYDLLDGYTGFGSVRPADCESLVPSSMAKHLLALQDGIITVPCATRYRLLQNTNGFLVGLPVPDEIKAEYGFDSLPIEHSSMCVLAMFRKGSQKKPLIDEYIQNCSSLLSARYEDFNRLGLASGTSELD